MFIFMFIAIDTGQPSSQRESRVESKNGWARSSNDIECLAYMEFLPQIVPLKPLTITPPTMCKID